MFDELLRMVPYFLRRSAWYVTHDGARDQGKEVSKALACSDGPPSSVEHPKKCRLAYTVALPGLTVLWQVQKQVL